MAHPADNQYEDRVLRPANLLREGTSVLEGFTFIRCHIIGPAIIAPLQNFNATDCHFEGPPDAVFWIIPDNKQVIGVIRLVDVFDEIVIEVLSERCVA